MNFATSAANQLAQTAPLNLSTERPLCGAFSPGFPSTCFAGLSWALRQSSFNTALLNIQSPFLTDLPSPLRLPSAAPLTMGCTEADSFYQEFSSVDSPPATDWGALSKWLDLQSGCGLPSPEFKLADGSEVEEEPKPNFNYIGLIAKAILSAVNQKMVLSEIYEWIQLNYPYFRNRGPGWRNSIRHNLSLNDCFVKVGRALNGKGHFWGIHPANLEDFLRGDYRRRRAQRKVRRALALVGADDRDVKTTTSAAATRTLSVSPNATIDTSSPLPGMPEETSPLQEQHLTFGRPVPPSESDPWKVLLANLPPSGDGVGDLSPGNCSSQLRKAAGSATRPAPFSVASFLSPDKDRMNAGNQLYGSCIRISGGVSAGPHAQPPTATRRAE